jgi:hypothetical protein
MLVIPGEDPESIVTVPSKAAYLTGMKGMGN